MCGFQTPLIFNCRSTSNAYLDLVLDHPSEVADDKGGLHDRCGDKVLVPLVLLLELGQQGDVCGMWETESQRKDEKTINFCFPEENNSRSY